MNLLQQILNESPELAELKSNQSAHSKRVEFDNKDMLIKFHNCRILRDGSLTRDQLFVGNGKILDPEYIFYTEKRLPDVSVDCRNLIIAPGFIDVQLNGAFGKDFTNDMENIRVNLDQISFKLLKYGVTAYCPTIVSSHAETYSKLIPNIEKTKSRTNPSVGASILGIHLEGPFISKEKHGAHELSTLRTLDKGIKSLEEVYGSLEVLKKNCKILTLAPELDLTGEVTEYLTQHGIVVSLGHTIAGLQQGTDAVRKGARCITHLFNAMRGFHHRDPHLIGLLSNQDFINDTKLYYGIISDGIHMHSSAVNIAHKLHPNGMVLVTDAMSALGLDDGLHCLGNLTVDIRHDPANPSQCGAYIKDTNVLCGAMASMNACVRNLINGIDCSIGQALQCASEHPARLLNIYPQKGSLNYGADADFILIDDEIDVSATFLNGDLVWSKPDWTPLIELKSNS